jgi:hypothetical protein
MYKLQFMFLGLVRMASSLGSSGQLQKIMLLDHNIEPSANCEVVYGAVGYVY